MRKTSLVLSVMLLALVATAMVQAQSDAHWPQWRGPYASGVSQHRMKRQATWAPSPRCSA